MPGPARGRAIEPVEGKALGKGTGPVAAPGNAITLHERVPPIVLAAPAPIARPIDQRTVPPGERSPQVRHDPRRGGPVVGRMADTSQGAVQGRIVLAVREVAVAEDGVAAAEGGVASTVEASPSMTQLEGRRVIMRRNMKMVSHARRGAAIAAAFVIGTSLFPMGLRASDQDKAKPTSGGGNSQLVFSSPKAALEALLLAFKGNDEKALLDIFGHEHEKLIVVTDKIARGEALAGLYERAQEKKTWIEEGEKKRALILRE